MRTLYSAVDGSEMTAADLTAEDVAPWCEECGEPILGEPTRRDDEVHYLGEYRARTWCSPACLEADTDAAVLRAYP